MSRFTKTRVAATILATVIGLFAAVTSTASAGVNGWNVFAGHAECQLLSPRTITIYPATANGTDTHAGVLDWQTVYWQPYSIEYAANGVATKRPIGPILHSPRISDFPPRYNTTSWTADDGTTYPYNTRSFNLLSTTTSFRIFNSFVIYDWVSQQWFGDYDYSSVIC